MWFKKKQPKRTYDADLEAFRKHYGIDGDIETVY
jgi:hypothetical protein